MLPIYDTFKQIKVPLIFYTLYLNGRIGEVVVKEGTVKVDIIMEIDENPDLSNVYVGSPYIPLIRRDETINDETLPQANQGIIQGKVFDEEMNEGLPFANVILLQEGVLIDQVNTDLDGNYIFEQIKPGKYDVEAVWVGYTNSKVIGILVEDNTIPLDISMQEGEGKHSLEVHVIQVNIPIIRMDKTTTGATWKAHEIKRFPGF